MSFEHLAHCQRCGYRHFFIEQFEEYRPGFVSHSTLICAQCGKKFSNADLTQYPPDYTGGRLD